MAFDRCGDGEDTGVWVNVSVLDWDNCDNKDDGLISESGDE